ncbi:MAG TPA: hypothetical protein VK668_08715 [Mucilaginibacter sp.]|nr:hypothetical protein [Mucilaginibacter sp.]
MRLTNKLLLLIICLFCLPGLASAQQLTVKGVIFKKNASARIAQAIITDLNSKVVMMSDELGAFSIKAAIGDTLLITKYDYTPEKRVIVNVEDLYIYMQPIIVLNQVVIKDQTKKQELGDIMHQYRSKGTFYDGKPPALSFLNSPLTGIYELFGKTPNNARRFAEFSKRELETDVVKRRYTKALVKNVTKLPDDEVDKFMLIFTPSYEDVKVWNDYELITYIKKNFDYYEKHKNDPQPKLEKLY